MLENPMLRPAARRRSLAKAISWRATGTVDTFVISFAVTGSIMAASSISLIEVATKMFLYYLHERAWERVAWGRNDTAPGALTSPPAGAI